MRGIHRSPVNSPHKGQWRGALMFSFICAWIYSWVNDYEAGDLRRHRAHYDVIVMDFGYWLFWLSVILIAFACQLDELLYLRNFSMEYNRYHLHTRWQTILMHPTTASAIWLWYTFYEKWTEWLRVCLGKLLKRYNWDLYIQHISL